MRGRHGYQHRGTTVLESGAVERAKTHLSSGVNNKPEAITAHERPTFLGDYTHPHLLMLTKPKGSTGKRTYKPNPFQ